MAATPIRRFRRSIAPVLAFIAAAGCLDRGDSPVELIVPVFSQGASGSDHGTHMTGAEVEGTPTLSRAQGQLLISVEEGGTALRYKLLVANIVDLTMAHIHLAPPGVGGPIVVWLYPSGPPAQLIPGRFPASARGRDGAGALLAEGTITDAQVIGPLAGQGVNGLLDAIRAGNAYANVHTLVFPAGEIRGQID